MIGQKSATYNAKTVEWKFTVNTEATVAGEKKTGIPFNLYNSTGSYLDVDWGDGNTSHLTPSSYAANNSTASVHEYAEAGTYQVVVKSKVWNKIKILTIDGVTAISTVNNGVAPLYWWRRTLTSIDNSLPKLAGKNSYASPTSYSTLLTALNNLTYLFCYCSKLQSIPSGLFDSNTTANSFRYCFFGCSSLQSIPAGLFDKNTAANSFSYCFYDCSSLQSIPSRLFDNNTAAASFSSCFYNCSSLQSIPSGLFDSNTAVTNFDLCFDGCSSLTSIPSGLFDSNTAATNFGSCFAYCSSLQSIPSGLFDSNTAVTTFSCCFCGCSSIQSIPAGLFDSNIEVTDLTGCFGGCQSLVAIPQDLFKYNTKVTVINDNDDTINKHLFENCSSLIFVPEHLFDSFTLVEIFRHCFHNCTSLQSIPSGLFNKNTAAISFTRCFQNCTSLQSIPSGLFDNNTKALYFFECFQNCTSLQSIPSGLFDSNIEATDFKFCFQNCSSLQSIPSGLFDNNTAVTSFNNCFQNCSSLQSIPAGLFNKNTAVTYFDSCFRECSSLQSIPAGLFDSNTAVTNFGSCFAYCSSLQSIPSGLFDSNTAVTTFQYCFYSCSSLKNFKLSIGSSLVTSFTNFISTASNVIRTICVPANSTTYTNLTAYANTSNNITVSTIEKDCMEAFVYTIDTEATTTGAVTGQIPLTALDVTSTKKIYIDWGDNTGAEILPSELASNTTHTYVAPGEYQITVATMNWSNYTLQSSTSSTFKETLVSIDEKLPLFANSTLDNLFYGCSHLESITGNLLDNHAAKTSADAAFKGCSSLAEIPASLLKKMENLSNADSMFEGCSALTYIPSGLLSQCRALTSTEEMFKDCTSLTYFPNTLLLNNTALVSTTDMFSGCTNSSPAMYTKAQAETAGLYVELFDTEATQEGDSKVGIPYNLTDQSVTLTVDWGDGNSTSLASSNYTTASSEASVHQYSNVGLYFVAMQSTNWTATSPLIYTSDIANDTYPRVVPIYWRRRTLIEASTALPNQSTTLKYYNSLTSTSMSSYTNSIQRYYYYCNTLRYIPSNLFVNVTAANFDYCFAACSSLQSIPSGLFNNNTAATSFYYCFYYCTKLASIPDNLFANNIEATNFGYCFYYCTSLQPFNITIGSSIATGFTYFFYSLSSSTASNSSICVPSNSTTLTNLKSAKNSYFSSVQIKTSGCYAKLAFTIDTEATTSGAVLGEIPIEAISNSSNNIMAIEWGDGTKVEANASNFASKSTHTYANPGKYQITVSGNGWSNYAFKCSNASTGTFKETVISIDTPLPGLSNASLDNMFSYCSHLESLPERLFNNLVNIEAINSAKETFLGCSSLTEIPADLLKKAYSLEDITSMFEGCSSVTYIPSGLISQCKDLTTTEKMFKECTSLTYYPNTLLVNNESIMNSADMFSGCSNTSPTMYTKTQLESNNYFVELHDTSINSTLEGRAGIPLGLTKNGPSLSVDWGDGTIGTAEYSNFSNNTIHQYSNKGLYFIAAQSSDWSKTNLRYATSSSYSSTNSLMQRQLSLIEASVKLPQMNTYSGSYPGYYAYYYCRNLKNISSGLFDNNTAVTLFSYCFNNCTSLQSIPEGLFDNNTAVTTFESCFYGCSSLQSIPSGLFDSNTAVTSFRNCFYNCSSLQSIPSGLFDSNTAVTTFYQCFYNCSSLHSIPSGLFDTCTVVDTFNQCFSKCSSLQSIPSGLFDKNTAVTTFESCFSQCSSLQSIPSGLFDNNTAVTNFGICFHLCSSLASIPSGLFDNNTLVTTFGDTFHGCNITSIPEGLFDNNTLVRSFMDTFRSNSLLQNIPENLFKYNTAVTNFSYCFQYCSSLNNFTIHIGSSLVSSCSTFVTKKAGTIRTVYIPTGSTTETNFNAQASTLGLTVIGE